MKQVRAWLSLQRDDGQASVQFVGILPFVLFAILLCFKIFATITTVERVDNAARTGAREASINHDLSACPREAVASLPTWLTEKENPNDHLPDNPRYRVGASATGSEIGEISCRVVARVPVIARGVPLNITVDRTVSMPG